MTPYETTLLGQTDRRLFASKHVRRGFAVLAAIIAHVAGERISRRQWGGVATVTIGVVIITLARI